MTADPTVVICCDCNRAWSGVAHVPEREQCHVGTFGGSGRPVGHRLRYAFSVEEGVEKMLRKYER